MDSVTIRELRNQGGAVVERVLRGESLVVTRDGRPVAQLAPLRPDALDSETLLERWRHVPQVDPAKLRSDLDEILDNSV